MSTGKLAEEFWRGRLAGVVGERFLQADGRAEAGGWQEHALDAEPALAARLEQVSAGSPVGRFILLAAALRLLMLRYTGRLDAVIAAPPLAPGAAPRGGVTFLRATPAAAGDASVGELLSGIAAELAELEGRAPVALGPFVDKLRALEWGDPEALVQLGLADGPGDVAGALDQVRLLFRTESGGGGLRLRVRFASTLSERALVPRLARHFLSALRAVLRGPEQRLGRIDLLDAADREELVRGVGGAPQPVPAEASLPSLVELVERRARLSPDRPALLYRDEQLDYRELDERANALAISVRGWLGAGREELVALVMDRSVEMVVAILAVLKAGAAYLPLDPAFPEERLGFMLRDSGASLVLTNRDASGLRFVPEGRRVVDVRALGPRRAPAPPARERHGRELALVIYTSGSTGEPKGVLLQHDSLVYKIATTVADLGFDETLRIPLLAAFSFDAAAYQILVPLWAGGTLLLLDAEEQNDPRRLWQRLAQHRINTINCVPPFLAAVLPEPGAPRPATLRTVILGGDSVPAGLVNRARALLGFERFINLYGPTETAIDVIRHVSTAESLVDPVPIGRPQPGTPVYILDEAMALVPVGVAGELYIGGTGVARGYLRREALTAERFLADPFLPGGRMYRTGDLGRFRADGEIEFLGRKDGQLKIRGNRVELGEVERELAKHPGVQEAIASARQGAGGALELVAHYVGPRQVEDSALRGHLRRFLPDFMVPARFVWLARWPLTPTGKVDRERLPDQPGGREVVAPRTELERALVPLWRDALGIEEAGVTDDFFELGGHSLKLIRLISAVHDRLGLELGFRDVFQHPTVEALAAVLGEQQARAVARLQRVPDAPSYPVSHGQRRIWMLSQLEPQAHLAYNMVELYRLDGAARVPLLERALHALSARHESLRTVFAVIDGETRQVVRASLPPAFEVVDCEGMAPTARDRRVLEALAEEKRRPFDLERGPLLRARMLRFSPEDHALALATHHIISDGWSLEILCRELMALYESAARGEEAALAPLAIQYRDFVAWQEAFLGSAEAQAQRHYWLERLAPPLPVLPLRTDFPRPEHKSFRAGARTFSPSPELLSRLRALCRETGLTLFMALLALVDLLLARHAGIGELLLCVPVAGRSRAELEPQLGFYVNTLILRTRVDPAEPVRALLQRVRATTLEAFQHQDYPFDRVVEESRVERALDRHPFSDVLVEMLLDPAAGRSSSASGLKLRHVEPSEELLDLFDLSFGFLEREDSLEVRIGYSAELFRAATVETLGGQLLRLMEEVVESPDLPVGRLTLLSRAERARLLEDFNREEGPADADATLQELFEREVARRPHAAAVFYRDVTLDFTELNARANRVAHQLRARQALAPDDVVAVLLDRSEWMVVAVLGAIKTGAAYLPLDPDSPDERLRYIFEESRVRAVLTDAPKVARLQALTQAPVLDARALCEAATADQARDPGPLAAPGNLAYLMYTSGSTGRPKGAMIEHRTVQRTVCWRADYYRFGPDHRVLQVPAVYFDSAVNDLFSTLIGGAALVILEHERRLDLDHMAELIARHGVTHVMMVPSLYQPLLQEHERALRTLKQVALAGERLPRTLVRDHFRKLPGVPLYNEYGPAEASVGTTIFEVTEPESEVLIGKPIWSHRVDVLDAAGTLLPIGVVGELCISGDCLARGYVGDERLTRERFVPHPQRPGSLMYRTGDLGRYLATGDLEFVGRADSQVKIRGSRVEPGEIEVVLLEHPDVEQSAVVARPAPGREELELLAYVVSRGPLDAPKLLQHLRSRLPAYMIPAHLMRVDALPRNANGKIDRRALPEPKPAERGTDAPREPRTPLQERLVQVWNAELGEPVGSIDDNFFELGGHSLMATRLAAAIRSAFGVAFSVRDVFERPTVRQQADHLSVLGGKPRSQVAPAPAAEHFPLSHAQRRVYTAAATAPSGAAFNVTDAFAFPEAPVAELLERALNLVVARHESLRTVFPVICGAPRQRVLTGVRLSIEQVELQGPPAALEAELQRGARTSFALDTWPLMAARLIRQGDGSAVLALTVHHLIADAWSIEVLVREWLGTYRALREGRTPDLSPPRIQYKDFVADEQQWVAGPDGERARQFWRERLSGELPVLELPLDFPRPQVRAHRGDVLRVELDAQRAVALAALARKHGASRFMVLYAAIAALMQRMSGQRELILGFPIAGRSRLELEDQVGCYVNAVPLRLAVDPDAGFDRLLATVRARCIEAYEHQDYPFDRIVEELAPRRHPGRSPLFDVGFTWEGAYGELGLPGVRALDVRPPEVSANDDLWFYGREAQDGIELELAYDTGLFSRATVELAVSWLRAIVDQVIADDGVALSALALAGRADRPARRSTRYAL